MESASNWLYFFSTIAQVFAALVGLSIIFYTYFVGKYQQDIVVKIKTLFLKISENTINLLEREVKLEQDENLKLEAIMERWIPK